MANEDNSRKIWEGEDYEYCDSEQDDDYEYCDPGSDGEAEEDEDGKDPGKPGYKVITKESLLAAQSNDLFRVMDMLGLQPRHARTLLIFHRWNIDGLMQKLSDHGEVVLFQEAGLACGAAGTSFETSSTSSTVHVARCGTCLDDVLNENCTTMDCGHCFCDKCWTAYFIMKIKEGQSRRMTCMEYKCGTICDERQIRRLVGSKHTESVDVFNRFLLESYIEDNPKVRWCPSIPHCGNAIRAEGEQYWEVECVCGQQFCFNCLGEPHSPCPCVMWQQWAEKCKDASETENWLKVHTKPCPTCHKPVEKDGGCNHVNCSCGQDFCWLCGSATGGEHDYETISGHRCGQYIEDKEKEKAKAEEDLMRYLHYHSRWKGHTDSFKFAEKQREELTNPLQASGLSWEDTSWLYNGLQRLLTARRALALSFVFAFFMFGNHMFKDEISEEKNVINQNLFESQQTHLEETVEKLSKLVESAQKDKAEINREIWEEVISLSTLTDNLCKVLHDVIEKDLLGSLEDKTHQIPAYRSYGAQRASEIEATIDHVSEKLKRLLN